MSSPKLVAKKPKPAWICQACTKEFTTKYSLERHWKRFESHKGILPSNPRKRKESRKSDTVSVLVGKENQPPMPIVPQRQEQQLQGTQQVVPASLMEHPSQSDNYDQYQLEQPYKSIFLASDSQHVPLTLPSVAVVEDTPPPISFFGDHETRAAGAAEWEFPFLPHYLENDEVLKASPRIPAQSPPMQKQSPVSAHFSRIFGNDENNSNPPFSSPMNPPSSSSYADHSQVYSSWTTSWSAKKKRPVSNDDESKIEPRSPVNLTELDSKFMLGDEETTSPFSFLEKSSLIAPPTMSSHNKESGSSGNSACVSLTDLDLEFLAPTV